jgi:hypothetical protein
MRRCSGAASDASLSKPPCSAPSRSASLPVSRRRGFPTQGTICRLLPTRRALPGADLSSASSSRSAPGWRRTARRNRRPTHRHCPAVPARTGGGSSPGRAVEVCYTMFLPAVHWICDIHAHPPVLNPPNPHLSPSNRPPPLDQVCYWVCGWDDSPEAGLAHGAGGKLGAGARVAEGGKKEAVRGKR